MPPSTQEAFADVPHVVYRCFDADDALLYIGCTRDLNDRFRQHRAQRSGFLPFTARMTLDWLPTRLLALRAERAAIEEERPLFNKTRRDGGDLKYPTRGYVYLAEHGVAVRERSLIEPPTPTSVVLNDLVEGVLPAATKTQIRARSTP